MSDQPDIPVAGSFDYNDQVIAPKYAVDPNASYQNVFKYMANPDAAGTFNPGNLTNSVPSVEKNLTDFVRWKPGQTVGNEGNTYEPGDWQIDYNRMPTAKMPWSKVPVSVDTLGPAFSNEEDLQKFKKDPAAYMQQVKKNLGPEYAHLLPYFVPQYDKNYGWVTNRNAGNIVAQGRFDKSRVAKLDALGRQGIQLGASFAAGALGMPSWAMTAVNTARGLANGADWKNIALNIGTGMLGNYVGDAVGGGWAGTAAKAGLNIAKGLVYPSATPTSRSGLAYGTPRPQYPYGG